jgi:hypothetical protein
MNRCATQGFGPFLPLSYYLLLGQGAAIVFNIWEGESCCVSRDSTHFRKRECFHSWRIEVFTCVAHEQHQHLLIGKTLCVSSTASRCGENCLTFVSLLVYVHSCSLPKLETWLHFPTFLNTVSISLMYVSWHPKYVNNEQGLAKQLLFRQRLTKFPVV